MTENPLEIHEKKFDDQHEAEEYADALEAETGKDYEVWFVNRPQTGEGFWIVEEKEAE